ncbi:MAG: glycosyltransferase family 9 protein [Bdellovibrionota bacterium]
MKILVIQTAFLGDVLLSIPTLLRLKSLYQNSEVTLLCRKGVGEIFRELKLADIVIELNKKNKEEFSETFKSLKKNSYDLLLCPHESYRSAFMTMQIKAKEKIGFKDWWNPFLFTKFTQRNMDLPDALRQLSLLAVIDAGSKAAIANYLSSKKIPDIAQMGLRNRILGHPKYSNTIKKFNILNKAIFIAPGSVWNTKRWTPDGFKKAAQNLSAKNPIVFIGSPDERDLCTEISNEVPGSINLAGNTSLFELLTLMSTGKLLLSNDSGSMHMGSVAELPTVAVFGPTVLSLGYEPWQEKAIVVENKELKCRPCGKHGHQKCPIGTHECMKSISSQAVIEAAERLSPIRG